MNDSWVFFGIFVIGLAILAGFLVIGSVFRTRWGINFKPVNCPRCGTPAPKIRTPASLDETLWGGSTCQNCGCKFDKWGRDLSKPGTTSG
jgi:hypothetical protein